MRSLCDLLPPTPRLPLYRSVWSLGQNQFICICKSIVKSYHVTLTLSDQRWTEMTFFYVIKTVVKFLQGTASIKSEEVTVLVRFSSRTIVRQVRCKECCKGRPYNTFVWGKQLINIPIMVSFKPKILKVKVWIWNLQSRKCEALFHEFQILLPSIN